MVSNYVILTPKAKENWVGPVYIFYWLFFPKKHYSSWKKYWNIQNQMYPHRCHSKKKKKKQNQMYQNWQ